MVAECERIMNRNGVGLDLESLNIWILSWLEMGADLFFGRRGASCVRVDWRVSGVYCFFSVFRVNYFCLLLCLHKRCATNWDMSIFRKSTASEMVSHRIEKPHRKKRKMTGLNENCIEWTQFMAMHKQPHSTTNQPPYITYYIVLFRKAGDANITHIKIDSTLITSMF